MLSAFPPMATGQTAPTFDLQSHSTYSDGTLPPEQREAVELAYFRGLTHAEIARMLEIPMGTVKTRLRLAIGKLRTALAPIKDWVQ